MKRLMDTKSAVIVSCWSRYDYTCYRRRTAARNADKCPVVCSHAIYVIALSQRSPAAAACCSKAAAAA